MGKETCKANRSGFAQPCRADREPAGIIEGGAENLCRESCRRGRKISASGCRYAEKPDLPIDVSDRQENLRHEREPKQCDDPVREGSWNCAVETHRRKHDQHDCGVKKCMDVKGVDEVIDVKNSPADIENFQHEGE